MSFPKGRGPFKTHRHISYWLMKIIVYFQGIAKDIVLLTFPLSFNYYKAVHIVMQSEEYYTKQGFALRWIGIQI